jgi:hypothetical protein
MKKWIIGTLIGGILVFGWQTLSWTALELHRPANQYTAKQDSILNFLGSQLEPGEYFLPTYPDGASDEEKSKLMETTNGKPWAKVSYHAKWDGNMGMNILRGFIVSLICVAMLIWIIQKMNAPSFSTILLTSLFIGIIGYSVFPYSVHIWYETKGAMADFIDAILQWGLCGIWLGWWLRR